MIQITPQMRVMVAIEPADFRKGIDGLARLCKDVLRHDPFMRWFVCSALKLQGYSIPWCPKCRPNLCASVGTL
jgi:hypothetical protein